jgi:hypothetical protein
MEVLPSIFDVRAFITAPIPPSSASTTFSCVGFTSRPLGSCDADEAARED